MSLAPGTRLGPYEVIAQIGVGGMGEVYRATDTNLGRQVAIKVLPETFAHDPDRLARFEREAKTLASLNHPNIAQIHGLERSGPSTDSGHAVLALVMELVEGPTLADRLSEVGRVPRSGPAGLPIDEVLPIAKQIVEALEAAHEQGVVHRDLKPANIKVREDGVVKVLDFGLAKAMEPAGSMAPNASQSPTISLHATQAGMILGTAAYMSPEQARGRTVDKRADLWAFGCVLFEMLTGRRPFDGDDVAVTLGAVIHKEPDWRGIPVNTPVPIRRLLTRCLTKDPKGRIADASTARLEIVDAMRATESEASAPAADSARVRQSTWRRVAPIAAAAALTGIATGFGTWTVARPPSPRPVHLTMAHPAPEVVGGSNTDGNLALSPNGRFVAYVASASPAISNNTLPLYVRALDEPEPRLLSNTARAPFFSPDGQWVGFVEGNARLTKVALTGGPSVPIANVGGTFRGGSWGPDEAIVFATADLLEGLSRISAAGGTVEVLTTPDAAKGEVDHVFPEVLPGGQAVLFTILTSQGIDRSQIAVLDLATRTYKVVIQGGIHARYSASGHLVYGANGTLRAVGFDLARLEARGTPVPVLDGVQTKLAGAAVFGLSSDGTLVYLTGGNDRPGRTLVWLDRMGREEPVGVEIAEGLSRRYDDPVLSPDGTQVAMTLGQDTADSDVWVWSLTRRALTRLTFEPGVQRNAVWTRDGTRVVYTSGQSGIFWRNADGTGTAEALLATGAEAGYVRPYTWSVDGHLSFYDSRTGTVGMTRARENDTPTTLLKSPAIDARPSLSPDGRWLAYLSAESGRAEVYVRPFPLVDSGTWQLSTGGVAGKTPRWTPSGRTLVFGDASGLMEVTVETSPAFKASLPQRVLTWPDGIVSDFDISRDGTTFLAVKDVGDAAPGQLNVVLNWQEELKRLVPTR